MEPSPRVGGGFTFANLESAFHKAKENIKDAVAVFTGLFKENIRSLLVQEEKLVNQINRIPPENPQRQKLEGKLETVQKKIGVFTKQVNEKMLTVEDKVRGATKILTAIIPELSTERSGVAWGELQKVHRNFDKLGNEVAKQIKKNPDFTKTFSRLQDKLMVAELTIKKRYLETNLVDPHFDNTSKDEVRSELKAVNRKLDQYKMKFNGEIEAENKVEEWQKELNRAKQAPTKESLERISDGIEQMTLKMEDLQIGKEGIKPIQAKHITSVEVHPKIPSKAFTKHEKRLREFQKDFEKITSDLSERAQKGNVVLRLNAEYQYQAPNWEPLYQELSNKFEKFCKEIKSKDPFISTYIDFINENAQMTNRFLQLDRILTERRQLGKIGIHEEVNPIKLRSRDNELIKQMHQIEEEIKNGQEQIDRLKVKLKRDFDIHPESDTIDRIEQLTKYVAKTRKYLKDNVNRIDQKQLNKLEEELAKAENEMETIRLKGKKELGEVA